MDIVCENIHTHTSTHTVVCVDRRFDLMRDMLIYKYVVSFYVLSIFSMHLHQAGHCGSSTIARTNGSAPPRNTWRWKSSEPPPKVLLLHTHIHTEDRHKFLCTPSLDACFGLIFLLFLLPPCNFRSVSIDVFSIRFDSSSALQKCGNIWNGSGSGPPGHAGCSRYSFYINNPGNHFPI